MATNYSFMNQSSTFNNSSTSGNSAAKTAAAQAQADQRAGQNAYQANTAQATDPMPQPQSAPHTPGPRGNVPAMVPQGYGFQPTDYGYDPRSAPKDGPTQSTLGLGMQPFPQMTNDLNFFQNRNNQQGTATWMSTLPFWQAQFDANANTRDFNEDTRRWDINTNWTQGMDRANLGLQWEDRYLNRDAFNEGARQFDAMLPIQQQDSNTRQYDAQTGRLSAEYNNQNTQFANQTERMLGMDRNSIERLSVQNDFQIQSQQNRIQEMLANGTISNQQAQQEFQRLELAKRDNWESAANAIKWQDVYGGQQFQYAQLGQQGSQFQADLAYRYAALQAQQQQANAQAYGRYATPNVSRTRRNF